MKFEIGGIVDAVYAAPGQSVAAGTILARLKTEKLELEITEAEIDLDQQEAELAKLFEPELAEDIAAAQSDVASARLKLAELIEGPDQDEVTRAEAELALKQVALKKAQWEYDEVAYRGDVGAMPQADRLQEATLNFEIAQANHRQALKEATAAEIASARAALANTEAQLARLLQGPSPAEIASRQAVIDKARLTLRERRNNLQDAVLVAPTDGVLLEVNIEPGERVLNEADTPAVVIADTSAYLLNIQVDEIDIGQIRRGQEAVVSLDAFMESSLAGRVTDIAPRPTPGDTSGIVTFEVTITLDAPPSNVNLLPGMTATAAVETGRQSEAIVVPNRAIQIERGPDDATVFVEKLGKNGESVRVEVELGLQEDGKTQIKNGLVSGDQVIIRSEPDEVDQAGL
jgi:RND family efflux transporter MFP subunit